VLREELAARDEIISDQADKIVKLKEAGAKKVKYTEYPGVGHNSWDAASAEPELIDWLFSQKR